MLMRCPVKDCSIQESSYLDKKYCSKHGVLLVDPLMGVCGHEYFSTFKYCTKCGALMLLQKTAEHITAEETTTNIPEDAQELLRTME